MMDIEDWRGRIAKWDGVVPDDVILLKREEVLELLRMKSMETLRKELKAGKIEQVWVRGQSRISLKAIREYLREHGRTQR